MYKIIIIKNKTKVKLIYIIKRQYKIYFRGMNPIAYLAYFIKTSFNINMYL